MICPKSGCKGEFKMIEYKQLLQGRSMGIYQCQTCKHREVIR